MRWSDRVRVWLRASLRRRALEGELDAELQFHLDQQVAENRAAGMDDQQARAAARRLLGSVAHVKDECRDSLGLRLVGELTQDLRYTTRVLIKSPVFTVATILTLALGIGANATIFTLLDAVVLKPLPVPKASELITMYENGPEGPPDPSGGTGRFLRFSYPRFRRLETALGSQGTLAAVTRSARFAGRPAESSNTTVLRGQLVSGGYFATVGVAAARGRVLNHGDAGAAPSEPAAVISDGLWKRAFGARDDVVGRTIVINGVAASIVGVMPAGFAGIWTDAPAEVWLPLELQSALKYENNVSSYNNADRSQPWFTQDGIAWLNLVGRVSRGEAQEATALLAAANHDGVVALADTFTGVNVRGRPSMLAHTLAVEPLGRGFSGLRARYSDALVALAGMVAMVLLVTCANIASLMLARALGRAREVTLRLALGATTARLLRQCLTESLVLAGLGGALGVVMSQSASAFLARQVLNTTDDLPPVFAPDARLVAFSIGLSLVTAVLFGLAPAWRAIRMGRSTAVMGANINQRHTTGRSTMTLMRPLIAGQLALSVVVVFAAVLFGRTLLNVVRLDPGFGAAHLVTTFFDARASGYAPNQMEALSQRLVSAVTQVPGVAAAAVSNCGLIANCSASSGLTIEGAGSGMNLNVNWVGPGYFGTVGIVMVGGREFDDRDNSRGRPVAVISESVARRYFQDQQPLGRRLGIYGELDTEIVGVVKDVRSLTLHEPPTPMVYFPLAQPPRFRADPGNLDVRVAGDPAQAVAAIRNALRAAEPKLLIEAVSPMSDRLSRDVSRERLVAYLASAFAALALFLAALGLYGALAYSVARQTHEIGVRIALGARASEVIALVIRQSVGLTAVGILAGLGAAAVVMPRLRVLLFDVPALDVTTFFIVPTIFAAVVALAAYGPARRATKVDPLVALRSE